MDINGLPFEKLVKSIQLVSTKVMTVVKKEIEKNGNFTGVTKITRKNKNKHNSDGRYYGPHYDF